jgi:predicted RNase H-like nuclease (RuvC/YqgF family)
MSTILQAVKPEMPDRLRDVQRDADQKIVDELRDKITRLEARLEEMKTENERLEAWLKSEKRTYRLQYYGPGGHL